MPSNSRLFVKPFIGGINTELSSVEDAILNTSDELNCTILPEGIRGRRLGFNIERDGAWIEGIAKDATSVYYWDNVGKRDFDYIVVQRDNVLHFFIYSGTNISVQKIENTVDISKYIVNSSSDKTLKYASISGELLVVGDWIDPLKISWDFDSSSFKVEKVNIKWRDLIGLDDGLEIDQMPAELTPEHKYNLYNQGWDKYVYDKDNNKSHAVDKFKSTISLFPSNNMLHYLDKRGDTTSDYDTFELMKHYYGNTPAPKGHYILDYFSRSRTKVSGIVVENTASVEKFENAVIMHRTKKESDMYINALKDGSAYAMTHALNPEAAPVYFQPSTTVNSLTIHIYDACLQNGSPFPNTRWGMYERDYDELRKDLGFRDWYTGPVQLELYGVDAEGKEYLIKTEEYVISKEGRIGDLAISDVWNFDDTLEYDRYFLKINCLNFEDLQWAIAGYWKVDLQIYSTEGGGQLKSEDLIKGRIKDVVCFSGRYFYLVDDTVLFSQVLTETGQGYDKCYQEADPTSEEINDVVDTDGGYVKFPAMGYGKALKTFNRGVLVFGESSVYGLISPAEQIFTATSYDIVELSRAGLIGPESVVSTSDRVFYWSPLGIFQIGISEQTGNTIVAQSVSINTIQELYNNIPNFSKEHCKGVYDYVNNRIYWYYPTDEKHIEKLSGCLVLDLTHNAFMQFKVGEPSSSIPSIAAVCNTPNAFEIKPTMYVRVNGEKVVTDSSPVIAAEEQEDNFKRWTAIKHLVDTGDGRFSFGDYNSREFKDFDEHSYESYMVSRPIMFTGFSTFGSAIQDTANDKQVPILQTLFKRTEQSPLTSAPAPVEHVYKLKDDVSYISADPEYDITSDTLSKHSVAKAFIFNDKGLFKSCKIRVDVKDFKGKVIDLGAELICDKVTKKTINVYNKTVTNDYMYLEFDEALDTPHLNYAVRVVAEIRRGEVSKEKIHFTATFVQDRVSPLLPVFSGFKKIEVEDTEKLYSVGDFTEEYRLNARIPSMYMTAFQIEAIPPETLVDKNWKVAWECRTDGNSNLFNVYRDYVSYGTSSKEYPTETAFDSSIQYVNNLSKLLKVGLKSYNYNRTDWKGTKVRYKIAGLVPQYETAEVIKPKPNYIAPSGANIRMRWGWSLTDRSNRWDMVQNGYRPQKDFMHDEYVESRIHVRGRGKAFQVEIRNDGNKDFRLAGMNIMVRSK
jgi:hypothetical protein